MLDLFPYPNFAFVDLGGNRSYMFIPLEIFANNDPKIVKRVDNFQLRAV